ncbi:hypothetical protein GEV27_00350 [Aeromicrobium sp. S22]|uniref:hypothetical protein n=1 Tax=Aeromicrobium sp. S22 TaxID=2662029 RepID=UPI00129DD7F5|nr:hypothetical protein [Aeromicrobium sp. S22]MRJ99960.1 hypothetical protein [Aeromicrobium sp. S22]
MTDSVLFGVLLLVIGALIILQAHSVDDGEVVDRAEERIGLALMAGSALCWTVWVVLVGIRHEADRVLDALGAARPAHGEDPTDA